MTCAFYPSFLCSPTLTLHPLISKWHLLTRFLFAPRDIIKLTALFTARRGRPFLAALSAREGRNYQFDFLRPTHSLFGYFTRLVDQYSKVLLPARETLEGLKARAQEGARWGDLEVARKRARWEQVKREQDKKREDDKDVGGGEREALEAGAAAAAAASVLAVAKPDAFALGKGCCAALLIFASGAGASASSARMHACEIAGNATGRPCKRCTSS